LQSELARRIQLGGESFITTTAIGGCTVLRACFVNPLTSIKDVDALVDLIVETARDVTSNTSATLLTLSDR
jgi:hypothetical protein